MIHTLKPIQVVVHWLKENETLLYLPRQICVMSLFDNFVKFLKTLHIKFISALRLAYLHALLGILDDTFQNVFGCPHPGSPGS